MTPPDEILKFFAKLIEDELGIVYSEHNYFQLQNRLEEIARYGGMASMDDLHQKAKQGLSTTVRQLLMDVATNNETSFFRDIKIYRAFENLILKNVDKILLPNEPLSIWSAASSSGQEALSICMAINEFNQKERKEIGFKIKASDISSRILKKAEAGIYSQLEVQRGLPAPLLIKYFKKTENDQWQVSPDLLKKINFGKQNLREPFAWAEKFHVILCRNVLIYQKVESKKDILAKLCQQLIPGGYLIMGAGESLLGISQEFDQETHDGAVIYRKKKLEAKAA